MYQFIVAVKESRKEDKQTKTFNDVLLFLIDILFVFGPFLWVLVMMIDLHSEFGGDKN